MVKNYDTKLLDLSVFLNENNSELNKKVIVELDPDNHVVSVADLPYFPPLFSFIFQVFFVSVLIYPTLIYFQDFFNLFIISKLPFKEQIKKDQRKETEVFVNSFSVQKGKDYIYYPSLPNQSKVFNELVFLRFKNELSMDYLIAKINELLIKKEISKFEIEYFLRQVLQL